MSNAETADTPQPNDTFGPIRGESELHSAAERGDVNATRALLANGANVNAMDNNQYTPLLRAAREGHLDVVHLLIANGANVNAMDNNQYTPLLRAAQATPISFTCSSPTARA